MIHDKTTAMSCQKRHKLKFTISVLGSNFMEMERKLYLHGGGTAHSAQSWSCQSTHSPTAPQVTTSSHERANTVGSWSLCFTRGYPAPDFSDIQLEITPRWPCRVVRCDVSWAELYGEHSQQTATSGINYNSLPAKTGRTPMINTKTRAIAKTARSTPHSLKTTNPSICEPLKNNPAKKISICSLVGGVTLTLIIANNSTISSSWCGG